MKDRLKGVIPAFFEGGWGKGRGGAIGRRYTVNHVTSGGLRNS